MFPILKAFFLKRGIGVHKEQLTAFELACVKPISNSRTS
jgi:pyruvoyl-dependent arginine decarboxylase (PvlArgDC)